MKKLMILIKRIIKNSLKPIILILVPIFAPIFSYVAKTGVGFNICLLFGFAPIRLHFYSGIPDLRKLKRSDIWTQRTRMPGIDFRPKQQVAFLKKLGKQFGNECNWPAKHSNAVNFHTENGSFSFGCAASTHTMIRYFKPRRFIEIGSGNSSIIIQSALKMNRNQAGEMYSIIDPFPGEFVRNQHPEHCELIQKPAEDVALDFFTSLKKNDILFIDSSHVVRTGGEVNYLFLEILPRLNAGVIVHIHDIPMPWEYPKVYAMEKRFFWTESYLLQSFLCFNSDYEILLAMRYLMAEEKKTFREAFSSYDPSMHLTDSGSFWIRRKVRSKK